MKWIIDDKGLTGPIDFDARIENVKSLLGEPGDQFKRTLDSDDMVIAYDEIGVHLNVNSEGFLTRLTVFPDNEVFIGSIQLVNKLISSIYSELKANGVEVEREDGGLWCDKQKVFLIDVEGIVDGVEIYYESIMFG